MLNKIKELKDRISKKSGKFDLIEVYHFLMVHYGYIPFEEFKKMDSLLVNELVGKINKMNKEENKPRRKR